MGTPARVVEEVVGVEVAVAQVVEPVAVELVGARAGDQLHLRAGAAAVLRLAAVGDHAGLFHRIGVVGGQRQPDARRHRIVHVDAVQGVVVAALAQAVDVREAVIGAAGRAVGLRIDLHARLEDRQRDGRARQLRQCLDIFDGHRIGHLRIGGLHVHRVGGHLDHFGKLADFQRDGLRHVGGRLQLDALDAGLAEAGGFDVQLISARLQRRQHIIAAGTAHGFCLHFGADVNRGDLGVGQHRARGVVHGPYQTSGLGLRKTCGRAQRSGESDSNGSQCRTLHD